MSSTAERAHLLPPEKGTKALRLIVLSACVHARGRAYGMTTLTLSRRMTRQTRRTLIAMALLDCRAAYVQRIEAGA